MRFQVRLPPACEDSILIGRFWPRPLFWPQHCFQSGHFVILCNRGTPKILAALLINHHIIAKLREAISAFQEPQQWQQ
jgi:hypothetical protein